MRMSDLDRLKERLRKRKAFGLNGSTWIMLCEPDQDCRDALATIEQLEQWHDEMSVKANELEQECADLRKERKGYAATLKTFIDGQHGIIADLRAKLEAAEA